PFLFARRPLRRLRLRTAPPLFSRTERALMSNLSRLTILLAALLVLPVCAPATLRASDPSAAQGKLVQRCYQVADLVVPVDGMPCGGAEKHTLEKSLVNLIR